LREFRKNSSNFCDWRFRAGTGMHGVSDRQDCYRSHEWGIVIDRIEVYRSVVRVEEGSRLTEFKVNG
jgi:hypothetical protein